MPKIYDTLPEGFTPMDASPLLPASPVAQPVATPGAMPIGQPQGQAQIQTPPIAQPSFDQPPEGFTTDEQVEEEKIKEPDTLDWFDVFAQAAVNVPQDAKQYYSDTLEGIAELATTHPSRTGQELAKTLKGITGTFMEGEQEYEDRGQVVVDHFKKKYGSIENFKKTVAMHPVQVLADASGVLSGVGGLVSGVGKVGQVAKLGAIGKAEKAGKAGMVGKVGSKIEKGFEAIQKGGEKVKKFGAGLDPTQAPFAALKKIGETSTPLYKSAVKFATKLSEKERNALAMTALDNAIMPTYEGINKLGTKIENLNEQISGLIDRGVKEGKTIKIKDMFRGLKDYKKSLGLRTDTIKSQKAVDEVRKQISMYNHSINRKTLTPAEAQTFKRNIYKELESQYSKMTEHPIPVETKMKIASNLRERLENIFPGIKNLNKNDADLIELRKALDKPVSRISNRDVTSIATKIVLSGAAGGSTTAASGSALAGLGVGGAVALTLFDNPTFKAKLAIINHKLGKMGIEPSPLMAALTEGVALKGRLKRESGKKSKISKWIDDIQAQ